MPGSPISTDDVLLFCNRTIEGMLRAVDRLDDTTANTAPLESANTPAQLVVHSLAACDWWVRGIICGDHVERDRDGEFEAVASVDELRHRCEAMQQRLTQLAPRVARATTVHGEPTTQIPLGQPWTVGAALVHAYEELAQHLGHLEVSIDHLLADEAG